MYCRLLDHLWVARPSGKEQSDPVADLSTSKHRKSGDWCKKIWRFIDRQTKPSKHVLIKRKCLYPAYIINHALRQKSIHQVHQQMTSKFGKNKKVVYGDSRVCHWCSYHILTSSVIYLLNRRTATWNLFVLYNKKTYNFSYLFQNLSQLLESRPLPTLANTKKSHLT